jgi:hypothetical protein
VYSIVANETFDATIIYYESAENVGFEDKSDLLITKATGSFTPGTVYYTYNPNAKVNPGHKTGAV